MAGGYVRILLALRIAPISYVGPARELSIVLGTLLGVTVLGERRPRPAWRTPFSSWRVCSCSASPGLDGCSEAVGYNAPDGA
jgi:hypothetical protein